MALKIFLSVSAQKQLEELSKYLTDHWGSESCRKFILMFDSCLETISEFPDAFPVSYKNKNLHRCIIAKQVSIFYRVKNNTIEIAFLFDNRQSPDKLGNLIKEICKFNK